MHCTVALWQITAVFSSNHLPGLCEGFNQLVALRDPPVDVCTQLCPGHELLRQLLDTKNDSCASIDQRVTLDYQLVEAPTKPGRLL